MKTKCLMMQQQTTKVRRIAIFAYKGVEVLDIGGPV